MSRSLFSPSLADLATFKPSMRSDSGQQLGDIGWLNNPYNIREACKLKNVPKSGKSPKGIKSGDQKVHKIVIKIF